MLQLSEFSFIRGKFTKVLPNSPFFINAKNLFIDQWLSKMQNKFKINCDHYQLERSKLIHAKNRVGRKVL